MPDVEAVRVSTWQRQVLIWLLNAYEHSEQAIEAWAACGGQQRFDITHPHLAEFDHADYMRGALVHWGIRWSYLAHGTRRTTSAVRSRALRSLEQRGYIVRRNQKRDTTVQARTTHVALTPLGRQVAEALRGSRKLEDGE